MGRLFTFLPGRCRLNSNWIPSNTFAFLPASRRRRSEIVPNSSTTSSQGLPWSLCRDSWRGQKMSLGLFKMSLPFLAQALLALVLTIIDLFSVWVLSFFPTTDLARSSPRPFPPHHTEHAQ